MIRITGQATLKVPYAVTLSMTEAQFDALSERKQNEIIDSTIDWHSSVQNADTDDIDIDDIEEINEEEK